MEQPAHAKITPTETTFRPDNKTLITSPSMVNFTDNELPLHHFLHASYSHPTLLRWQQLESHLTAENLVLPLFICDGDNDIQTIDAMPGVSRYGVNRVLSFLQPLVDLGLRAVLLFGIVNNSKKDEQGKTDTTCFGFAAKPLNQGAHHESPHADAKTNQVTTRSAVTTFPSVSDFW